jgi:hypothetical protein
MPKGEKGILEAYLRGFAAAKDFIYLETQYFTNDGQAIHENFWRDPALFGIPSSHGCLGIYSDAGEKTCGGGCIREQDSLEQLVHAIRLAAARQVALTADLMPMLLRRVSALANRHRQVEQLTSFKYRVRGSGQIRS